MKTPGISMAWRPCGGWWIAAAGMPAARTLHLGHAELELFKGERAGVDPENSQKKGYLCRHGSEWRFLAAGFVPEKSLTVWIPSIAEEINKLLGRRVALYYESTSAADVVLRRDRPFRKKHQS